MGSRHSLFLAGLMLVTVPALITPSRMVRAAAPKPPPGPIVVSVDASEVARDIFHTHLVIPASPGPLTLLYPQWLPGEHGPTGPILQMAGLTFTAGGATIPWRRDLADNFTFHCDVPAGASSVDVTFDYLSPSGTAGFTAAASASENLAVLSWNTVVLYPAGYTSEELTYTASLKLPDGWKFGTALPVTGTAGSSTTFGPVSLTTLVDAPVLTGRFYRVIPLTSAGTLPAHEIDVVADSEAALNLNAARTEGFKRLVSEAQALFGAHHYTKYHFLVTLSDAVSHFGLEHHESSDDRTGERAFIDDDRWTQFVGLLPHEFVHSWNGKFRRPAGLATPDYQKPMQADMLWVYEGLTEYLGYVLTARSGLQTQDEFREDIAHVAALLDHRSGRTWRPNQDTATMAAQLYNAPGEWANYRRGVDFYDEGVLLWLDIDTVIRQQSNGAKSIDDFCRMFHGAPSGAPMVKPYTFDDVVSTLNQVAPYDWRTFIRKRLDSTDAHADFGGVENGGWRVVYNETPNRTEDASEKVNKTLNLTYSGGLILNDEGGVGDIVKGSPADRAGLSPGMTIVAVNGRKYSGAVLRAALAAAKGATRPIDLIVQNGEFFKTTTLEYHDGVRYPHLERDASKADMLGQIAKPLGH